MNNCIKGFLLLVFLGIGFSCSQSITKETIPSKETIVQRYYQALNKNDFDVIRSSVADNITQVSGSYTESWSRESFTNWLEWDSSFSSRYTIFDVEKITEDKVKLTVSKTCNRIQFLNEEPTRYIEFFHFENNKIRVIEAGEYLVFNDSLWVAKRDTLIAYINREHPELDGFIYDQTKKGAKNYLKAIALYEETQH